MDQLEEKRNERKCRENGRKIVLVIERRKSEGREEKNRFRATFEDLIGFILAKSILKFQQQNSTKTHAYIGKLKERESVDMFFNYCN